MQDLPVELIAQIAFHACTDGGATGAALSRVSTRMRDTTHPARFHTLALTRPATQLAPFLSTHTAQRARLPHTTPRVRHLLLSLLSGGGEPIYARPALQFGALMAAYDAYVAELHALGAAHGASLAALVRALAPELETALFVRGEWKGVPAVHVPFPRLRELTLVDAAPEFLRLEDVAGTVAHPGRARREEDEEQDKEEPEDAPLFPALERLHVLEHFYARPVDLRLWARHAPAVTHLRCSGLRFRSSPTVDSLKAVLADAQGEGRRLFPCLEEVMLQAKQEQVVKEMGACVGGVRNEVRLAVLPAHDPLADAMAASQEADEVGKETAPMKCVRRAKELWLERIEGGEGCWSESYAF